MQLANSQEERTSTSSPGLAHITSDASAQQHGNSNCAAATHLMVCLLRGHFGGDGRGSVALGGGRVTWSLGGARGGGKGGGLHVRSMCGDSRGRVWCTPSHALSSTAAHRCVDRTSPRQSATVFFKDR